MITDNEFYTAGSSFDGFLLEEGILYEAKAIAMKKVIAFQIRKTRQKKTIKKKSLTFY
jgi:hypothetical protein